MRQVTPVLVHNLRVLPVSFSAKQFLLYYPDGVYSAARTIGRTAIVEFNTHLQRLAYSSRNFFPGASLRSVQQMSEFLRPSIQLSMRTFLERFHDVQELKITILLLKTLEQQEKEDVYVHTTELAVPASPTVVEVRGNHPRDNPEVKYSSWAKTRKVYEDCMASDVNEVVLQDDKGNLYEGLSSNFFVLVENTNEHGETIKSLLTAPHETVLTGTIQQMVFKICQSLNVPVIHRLPNISEIRHWKSAFITSTSRGVLAIKTLRLPQEKDNSEVHLGVDELVEKLRELVFQDMKINATPIF